MEQTTPAVTKLDLVDRKTFVLVSQAEMVNQSFHSQTVTTSKSP
jgi:hypothetical protein